MAILLNHFFEVLFAFTRLSEGVHSEPPRHFFAFAFGCLGCHFPSSLGIKPFMNGSIEHPIRVSEQIILLGGGKFAQCVLHASIVHNSRAGVKYIIPFGFLNVIGAGLIVSTTACLHPDRLKSSTMT